MHPFLPLPINFDTSIPAGWGLLEWHIVVTPDLDTLMMALPAGTDAEFQMGDEPESDDGGSEGVYADTSGQGLPPTEGTPWDEEEEDDTELGRLGKQLSHVRRLNLPVRWTR